MCVCVCVPQVKLLDEVADACGGRDSVASRNLANLAATLLSTLVCAACILSLERLATRLQLRAALKQPSQAIGVSAMCAWSHTLRVLVISGIADDPSGDDDAGRRALYERVLLLWAITLTSVCALAVTKFVACRRALALSERSEPPPTQECPPPSCCHVVPSAAQSGGEAEGQASYEACTAEGAAEGSYEAPACAPPPSSAEADARPPSAFPRPPRGGDTAEPLLAASVVEAEGSGASSSASPPDPPPLAVLFSVFAVPFWTAAEGGSGPGSGPGAGSGAPTRAAERGAAGRLSLPILFPLLARFLALLEGAASWSTGGAWTDAVVAWTPLAESPTPLVAAKDAGICLLLTLLGACWLGVSGRSQVPQQQHATDSYSP